MKKIKDLNIGDFFSIRKNGTTYEYLGYCPIENMPTALKIKNLEILYFENENKKVYL